MLHLTLLFGPYDPANLAEVHKLLGQIKIDTDSEQTCAMPYYDLTHYKVLQSRTTTAATTHRACRYQHKYYKHD